MVAEPVIPNTVQIRANSRYQAIVFRSGMGLGARNLCQNVVLELLPFDPDNNDSEDWVVLCSFFWWVEEFIQRFCVSFPRDFRCATDRWTVELERDCIAVPERDEPGPQVGNIHDRETNATFRELPSADREIKVAIVSLSSMIMVVAREYSCFGYLLTYLHRIPNISSELNIHPLYRFTSRLWSAHASHFWICIFQISYSHTKNAKVFCEFTLA
jgi:hypothetical protein